jgi:hypothetical protein
LPPYMYISIQANSVSLDSAIRAVQQQQSELNTVLRIRITMVTAWEYRVL